MADTKISALPAASALSGAEEFAVNQGGASKKATATQVKSFADTFPSGDPGESAPALLQQTAVFGGHQGLRLAGPLLTGGSAAEIRLVGTATGSYIDLIAADGVNLGAVDSGDIGTGTFRDSVDARIAAQSTDSTEVTGLVNSVAPTVTMTTGGVGTGAFRDAVDARANAMSAARMQAGTASSGTVVAATAKVVTVTFPTAFSSAPKVTLTGISSDPGVDRRVSVVPGSETTTQFQVAFWRSTGTASFDTNWLAVKP